MKIPVLLRSNKPLSTLFACALLQGCLSDGSNSTDSGTPSTGSVEVQVSPLPTSSPSAARALAAEPGGWVVARIRRLNHTGSWTDSIQWLGSSQISLSFANLPEGTDYAVSAFYRDAAGRTTHADSASPVAILPGSPTPVPLSLKVLLGRIVITMPSVPTTVDSLGIRWSGSTGVRRAVIVRGTSGKTLLRLDSLPVGVSGAASLRAWDIAGDTLYGCDTTITVSSQADLSLTLHWLDASGSIALSASILAGGETDATALFPGDQVATGRLRLVALSDSSNSDWALVGNPGSDSVVGQITLVHGTESVTASVALAPGGLATLSRASCSDVARTSHPLHGAPGLVCGLSLSVAWSTTGTLWELHAPDGSLAERALVWDGKNGWPDLNSSTARTLRRRTGTDGTDPMAGRSWCADSSDSPTRTCS
ncbi:MAG TPA: hypothetical protein VN931_06955 [Fibrobacteria bacterium]|nr:hypothetical protein [Fibrobacteria bacterium]